MRESNKERVYTIEQHENRVKRKGENKRRPRKRRWKRNESGR